MESKDEAGQPPAKRGRGRPALGGKTVPVSISEVERATAMELGDGKISAGVRIALRAARSMGTAQTRRLAGLGLPDGLSGEDVHATSDGTSV